MNYHKEKIVCVGDTIKIDRGILPTHTGKIITIGLSTWGNQYLYKRFNGEERIADCSIHKVTKENILK